MIGNLKKYIDKASFMEHIDAKLRQNEPMIIDSCLLYTSDAADEGLV